MKARIAAKTLAFVAGVAIAGGLVFGGFTATHAAPAAADYQPVTSDRLASAASDDGWLMYLRTYDSQAHVPFTQITADNVSNLKEVFTYSMPIQNGFEAPPIVNGHTLIYSEPLNHVVALDSTNGKLLWKYDYPLPKKALRTVCCDVVNRGVALYGGNAYLETLDDHVVALDAQTGKVVWNKAVYPDAGVGFFMTGAPLVVKGSLIVGCGGGEYGARSPRSGDRRTEVAPLHDPLSERTGRQYVAGRALPARRRQSMGDRQLRLRNEHAALGCRKSRTVALRSPQGKEPLHGLGPRDRSRYRQDQVVFPRDAERSVGLRRRRDTDPRRRNHQRDAAQSLLPGRPQRLLLRRRSDQRQIHLRDAVHEGNLDQRLRFERERDRKPGQLPARRKTSTHVPGVLRGQQLVV